MYLNFEIVSCLFRKATVAKIMTTNVSSDADPDRMSICLNAEFKKYHQPERKLNTK